MMEDKAEVDEVSVVVKDGISGDLEVKVVNEVDGSDCDVKGDVEGNGEIVANGVGDDECDNYYVLMNGSAVMVGDTAERGNVIEGAVEVSDRESLVEPEVKEEEVEGSDRGQKDESEEVEEVEDTAERGNMSEVSVEVSDQEVLGESGFNEKEVEGLERGQKHESEDCETPVVVENCALVSNDAEQSHAVDSDKDAKMDVVEEIEMVDEEAEQGEVVDSLQVEETAEAEYSNKLEDLHETINVASNCHESQQSICSGAAENGDADIGIPNPSIEEKLDSDVEITESNETEHTKEELEKESNGECSLDKKDNQDSETLEELEKECYEEPLYLNGNQESENDVPVSGIDESLSGKVIAVLGANLSEEEHRLVIKSEVSSDVKDNRTYKSYTPVEELDFSTEEQNNRATLLPVESIAEFGNGDISNNHDDFLSSKINGAHIDADAENNINSDVNSGQNEELGAVNPTSTEQGEKGLEYQTQVGKSDNETAEAEQTVSKDILLDSAIQENKELASEITDMLCSSLVTECADGPSINGDGHDLADVIKVVEIDTDTGESNVPIDNEWPELSYYTARRKICTVSISEVHGTQGSVKRESEEIHLAVQDRQVVPNGSSEDDDPTSHKKEVVDTSLSEDSENACADSGTNKEINHDGESTAWADYSDQIDRISSSPVPSTCIHSHSVSDGVVTAANLENDVATSESGSKDDETNLNGKLEASKVEISSEEDSSFTFVESEVDRRPFFFLIKVPRFEDDEIREQIKFAQQSVDEKTRLRDSYKVPIQTKKDICLDFNNELEAAKLKEKAARDKLKAKRKEIDAIQAVIDKLNNAMMVEDIDGSIHIMEHKMQHETVPLSEEKQLMREIKRLRHFKEQLSSSIGSQEEIQEALLQKDQTKDHLKLLKREMNLIRAGVQRAEIVTKDAKKKCFDEYAELNQLQLEFKTADGVRQEAYMSLVSLRRELAQKNKFFWMYKDAEKLANDYALSGDKKSLRSLCVNQVERVMELWNTDDQFRNDYIKCNARSTLRRLKTFNGRSLGLNEEPPSLPNIRNDRVNHSEVASNSFSHVPPPLELKVHVPSVGAVAEKVVSGPVMGLSENKVAKKQSKSTTSVTEVPTVPALEITPVTEEEAHKTKEEEELLAKKEEEIRKREEEARMMEQLQMQERAKALEAVERKKRMAERAQARAKLRAKKEAEQREKEREKRLRKNEKRKDGKGNGTNVTAVNEPKTEVAKEAIPIEKPVTKKPYKPSRYVKGIKTTAMPINLRNRHRRKIHMWMWMGAVAIIVVWFGYLSY